jgi:hypothetical protein
MVAHPCYKSYSNQLAFLAMLYNFVWAFEGMFESANAFFLIVCVGKNTGRHLMHIGKLAKVKSLTSASALYVSALELKLHKRLPGNIS